MTITHYIQGWKAAAKYLDVHPRTLYTWSTKYLAIPWQPDGLERSRVRIPIALLDLWYQRVRKIRRELGTQADASLKREIKSNPRNRRCE